MIKRKQQNAVLELQNSNAESLKWVIACRPIIKKRKGNSKTNEQIKRYLYAWLTHNPQVVQSTISNDCLKVMFDDQTEPQLVPKLLLHVSVREIHNSLVSDINNGALKDSRDEDDNIIISDSTSRSLLLELFQLQMGLSFPFLRANDLCSSLLNIRARNFLISCT